RDAVRVRLLELAGNVPAAAERALEHHRARRAAVVDDGRFDLVADRELHGSGRRIAELGGVDDRLALAADLDERSVRAERGDAPAEDVDLAELSAARRRGLACREHGGEIFFAAWFSAVVGVCHERSTLCVAGCAAG